MFEFVRSRLSDALQLRLWRCCLQVCVTSPELSPWAQIPLALAAGIAKAPPGAAELVKTAIVLGADADALAPIISGLPFLNHVKVPEHFNLLSSRADAIKAEETLVAELTEVGVKMSEWAPPITMKVPKGKPNVAVDGALRFAAMRSVGIARRGALVRVIADRDNASVTSDDVEPVIATPARAIAKQQVAMESEMEAEPRRSKRLCAKSRGACDRAPC